MLEVKILINLQAGSGRSWKCSLTANHQAGRVSSCLETIEVIDPVFQPVRSLANCGWEDLPIRIDFQLGTNGGDANRVRGFRASGHCFHMR
jgi:hypothetical protein